MDIILYVEWGTYRREVEGGGKGIIEEKTSSYGSLHHSLHCW